MGNHIEGLERRLLFAAGALDTTYGTSGQAAIANLTADQLACAAVQGGSRVLVLSYRQSTNDLNLVRLSATGAVDASFLGTDLTVHARRGIFSAAAVDVLPDDGIAVAGTSVFTAFGMHDEVAFYTPSGKLDRSKGHLGITTFPSLHSSALGVTLSGITHTSDGSIYVVGTYEVDAYSGTSAVFKLTPDGKIDSSFGENGVFLHRDTPDDFYEAITVLPRPDGKIVFLDTHSVEGRAQLEADSLDATLLTADGKLDTFNYALRTDEPRMLEGAAMLDDGSFLTLERGETNSDVTLLKFDSTGGLVPSFGTGGKMQLGTEADSQDGATALHVQSDGKVLMTFNGELRRIDPSTGALDTTFGQSGIVHNGDAVVGIGQDGRIFQVGADSQGAVKVQARFSEEGPSGLLAARSITTAPVRPYEFAVTWHDDDGVDASSLLNSLQIVGPDGQTYKARFLRSVLQPGGAVVAIYKFSAPGGSWSAIDDGKYTIRVRSGTVKDTHGAFALANTLGTFSVAI